jgi:cell wall-associated NlpC family hydrolase
VSVGALVQYVGEVLGRSHALFGDPPDAAARAATGAGARLNDAGRLLAAGRRRFASLSGDFAAGYDGFTRRAGPALDRLAGLEDRVGGVLTDAAGSDRRGRAQSGAVLNGAASDTATLAAWSGTPAGQQLLLTQLRGRLIQQRQVITAYRARDARLAAMVRAMRYRTGFPTGARGMPWGGSPLGTAGLTGLGSLPGLSGLPSMSGLTRAAANRTTGRIHLAARHDPRAVPAGPGGAAVAAALTRRGDPYVWGAKGPNRFDCSGLTQWAWRQAGVQLGGDTYAQIHDGVAVPPGQVRAGDLIFPMDAFDGHGPGHVQLAVSASEVIHAPQSGDVVRLAPMPSSYVARRPVPSR